MPIARPNYGTPARIHFFPGTIARYLSDTPEILAGRSLHLQNDNAAHSHPPRCIYINALEADNASVVLFLRVRRYYLPNFSSYSRYTAASDVICIDCRLFGIFYVSSYRSPDIKNYQHPVLDKNGITMPVKIFPPCHFSLTLPGMLRTTLSSSFQNKSS